MFARSGKPTIIIPFLLFLSFLTGCATDQSLHREKQSGTWETKLQFKDIRKETTQQASMDVLAVWPDRLRFDVTATLGIAVASMTLQKDRMQILMYRNKKYFDGPVNEKVMQNVFHIPLNPKWFILMAFNQPIREKGWACQYDDQKLVSHCFRAGDGLRIDWMDREGERMLVVIANAYYEVQILFKTYSEFDTTKVQPDKDPFTLSIPDSFTKYNAN